jgi:acyl-CoA synthetase (AMP-forming)/AMP-acid ligase II
MSHPSGVSSQVLQDRLVPNIIDRRAKLEPHAPYAEYPVSATSYAEGFRRITIADFANAINGAAWWIHKTLGPGSSSHGQAKRTLAYIGPNDLRYPALVVGAAKAGYMVLFAKLKAAIDKLTE